MQTPAIDPARDASTDVHLYPPFIPLEGVLNCRALPLRNLSMTSPAHNTESAPRPWLLRSGDISRITPLGIAQLHSYGIIKIFDLRSPSDIAKFKSPVPVIGGVDIVKAPLFQSRDASSGKHVEGHGGVGWYADENMRKEYAEFRKDELGTFMQHYTLALEGGREAISSILRSLSNRKEGEGIMFHCSAGKDRTGIVAALILSLAEVNDTAIVEDYALTSVGLEPHRDAIMGRFEKDAAFQEEREGAMNMLSSRPETMRAFLALLRERYGGAEGYAKDISGLTDAEIFAIKKNLQ